VSLDADALASALDAIAAQDAPPSRVDADRVRGDGRRILRRRRRAAGLGGAGVVAVALAVAFSVNSGPVSGGVNGAGATGGRDTAQAVASQNHTADWDPLVAPGAFGWLPDNARNINYSVAPGPGQGSTVLGKGSQISDGTVGHDPAMIWLAVLDPSRPAPKAGPLNDGSGRILIPAPEVNGRGAFWSVDPIKRDPDTGAAGAIYFQSPTGSWAEVYGYYLGADPVATTLVHVARTATIGSNPVGLPIRISGLPKDATAQVAEVDRPTTVPGAAWTVGLGLSVGTGGGLLSIAVYPAAATPFKGTSFGDHCAASNGLRICVSVNSRVDLKLFPGGLDGLLHNITSLGPDPAHWTTDVVLVGH
jgi:hypothetical protein